MSKPGTPAATIATRQTHRPRVLAVINDDCTGCNTCVDYCLVDCIEPASTDRNLSPSSLVTIREDECIGCVVCAKVCEELGVNAIHLVPAAQTDWTLPPTRPA